MDQMVHMTKFAMHVYPEDLIHILFHLKSLQLPWGKFCVLMALWVFLFLNVKLFLF